ncbi:Uncharacterized protein LSUB1_G006744 [Lachnellula subtilissima]|uniref:NAD-dependent epimerase/dehydratase domain-containing protein n=1 Tax=Lachnellula subtilissima TaxID=602034 RepID=A0A8H8REA9_9HELO|nr:Uncharacterized protein LSUB1_G006744 [Lachnellula subtilissima]
MASAKPQRIFMTGANGYIGSLITEFAISEGYTVIGLSRSEKSDTKLRNLGAIPVRGDLHTYDVLTRESAQADVVIHLADALAGNWGMEYSEVVRIHNAAVDAIAEGLKGSGKPFIETSGSLVTAPDPNGGETIESSPLVETPLNNRIDSEKYSLAQCDKGIKVSALRLAPYVYGRGGSGVGVFMGTGAKNGEVTYVGDGSTCTTTVHVDDPARLYLLAIKNAKAGETYNATYETDVTSRALSEAMGEALGVPLRSLSFEDMASKMGQFFAKFLSAENRASNAKAVQELGWRPREKKILDDIKSGSYVELAKSLRKSTA